MYEDFCFKKETLFMTVKEEDFFYCLKSEANKLNHQNIIFGISHQAAGVWI